MSAENYTYNFICGECNDHNFMNLTKYEAAFFDSLDVEKRCKKCGSSKTSSSSRNIPEIDNEILVKWLADENLYFSSQDEDLIMIDISTERLISAITSASSTRTAQLLGVLSTKLQDERFSSKDEKMATISYLESI